MSGWQPIATAPHDTDILVWDGESMSLAQRAWNEPEGPVFVVEGVVVIRGMTDWRHPPAPPQAT